MVANKRNVDDVSNNLFILTGQEEERMPYDYEGMPEFVKGSDVKGNEEREITVRFRNKADFEEFASMMDQTITDKTKAIWYPAIDRDSITLLRWVEDDAE